MTQKSHKTLSTHWTKHLEPNSKAKKDLETAIVHDTLVLGRLKDIVDEIIQACLDRMTDGKWIFEVGEKNVVYHAGYVEGLKRVKDLLDFVDSV